MAWLSTLLRPRQASGYAALCAALRGRTPADTTRAQQLLSQLVSEHDSRAICLYVMQLCVGSPLVGNFDAHPRFYARPERNADARGKARTSNESLTYPWSWPASTEASLAWAARRDRFACLVFAAWQLSLFRFMPTVCVGLDVEASVTEAFSLDDPLMLFLLGFALVWFLRLSLFIIACCWRS
jgi:hypothetical protein